MLLLDLPRLSASTSSITPHTFTRPFGWQYFNKPLLLGVSCAIFTGPHTIFDLNTFIRTSPAHYPIRLYPDLTHSLTTQYPVPAWDRTLAITLSREAINPRPTQFTHIANLHLYPSQDKNKNIVGFSSYSEGCHDDINKFIWLAAAWGDDTDGTTSRIPNAQAAAAVETVAMRVVQDYARAFFGAVYADTLACVIMGLEQHWVGDLRVNTQVAASLGSMRALERTMQPILAYNWRFQQLQ